MTSSRERSKAKWWLMITRRSAFPCLKTGRKLFWHGYAPHRAQKLCQSWGGRPNKSYGFCGHVHPSEKSVSSSATFPDLPDCVLTSFAAVAGQPVFPARGSRHPEHQADQAGRGAAAAGGQGRGHPLQEWPGRCQAHAQRDQELILLRPVNVLSRTLRPSLCV